MPLRSKTHSQHESRGIMASNVECGQTVPLRFVRVPRFSSGPLE